MWRGGRGGGEGQGRVGEGAGQGQGRRGEERGGEGRGGEERASRSVVGVSSVGVLVQYLSHTDPPLVVRLGQELGVPKPRLHYLKARQGEDGDLEPAEEARRWRPPRR